MKKRILIALVALGSLICPALAQEAAVKTKMMGSFIGFHALGGSHNIGGMDLDFKFLGTDFSKLKDYRYEGWFIGAGVAYGYARSRASMCTRRSKVVKTCWKTSAAIRMPQDLPCL